VIDPLETTLQEGQVLQEEAYQTAINEFGPNLKLVWAAKLFVILCERLIPSILSRKLRLEIKETNLKLRSKSFQSD
jgi:DNA-directed RNA polymerase subunit beta'